MHPSARHSYYIHVTDVGLFNQLYAAAERMAVTGEVITTRHNGYYELRTSSQQVWQELYLYGQIVAQYQDLFIMVGEDLA